LDGVAIFILHFQDHESGVVAWASCALAVGDAEQADFLKSRDQADGRRPDKRMSITMVENVDIGVFAPT
jgi:hypothetical protein